LNNKLPFVFSQSVSWKDSNIGLTVPKRGPFAQGPFIFRRKLRKKFPNQKKKYFAKQNKKFRKNTKKPQSRQTAVYYYE